MLLRRFVPGILVCTSAIVVAACLSGCASTRPDSGGPAPARAASILHTAYIDSAGPWAIHVLKADMNDPGVRITSARPASGIPGRETTSSMAARETAPGRSPAGAVNADFYAGPGYTISPQVIGGEIVQTEPGRQSDAWSSKFKEQFGLTRGGRVLMERLQFAGIVRFESGGTYRVAGVNASPVIRGISILTAYSAPDSGSIDTSAVSVSALRVGLRGDTTIMVVTSEAWDRRARLARDALILHWDPDSISVPPASYEPGDTVKMVLGFDGQADPPRMLVGGLPRIVIDGRLNPSLSIAASGPPGDFARKRHPRTGVGVTRDSTTILLVTVDGRQAASVGMTLEEFGNLMLSLGAYQALNLDGGGSTTMVVDGAVANVPSDLTGERAVANCLVVLRQDVVEPPGGE